MTDAMDEERLRWEELEAMAWAAEQSEQFNREWDELEERRDVHSQA